MPASFVSCVDELLKEGKDKGSAYAICTVQYKKRHKGHTPQHDAKMHGESSLIDLTPTDEEIQSLAFMYEELEKVRNNGKT